MIFKELVYKLMRRWADWDAAAAAYDNLTGYLHEEHRAKGIDYAPGDCDKALRFESQEIIDAAWRGMIWDWDHPVKLAPKKFAIKDTSITSSRDPGDSDAEEGEPDRNS